MNRPDTHAGLSSFTSNTAVDVVKRHKF